MQQHREQSIARVILMTQLCRQLSEGNSNSVSTGFIVTYDQTSMKFSLKTSDIGGSAGTTGEGEEGGTEYLDESFELERSLSLGFSDSDDDDVIEELSEDEDDAYEGEEEEGRGMETETTELRKGGAGESGRDGSNSQNECSSEREEDSEIELLKVSVIDCPIIIYSDIVLGVDLG